MSDTTAATAIGATLTGAPPVARASRSGGRMGRVRWWTYLLLGLAALGSVFPLYWMFIVSSTDSATATRMPPEVLPGGNFFVLAGKVFDTVPFLQSIVNSLLIATTIGVGQALLCARPAAR
jgi:cellobiose transport system permease protein